MKKYFSFFNQSSLILIFGVCLVVHIPAYSTPDTLLTVLRLRDGSTLRGYKISEQNDTLQFRTGEGLEIGVPLALIIEQKPVVQIGESKFDGASRYLYAPSSYNLQQGQLVFSQKMVFFSHLDYGLFSRVTLSVGAALPFYFVERGQHLLLSIKTGHQLHENFGIQGGVGTILAFDQTFIAPFFGATAGKRNYSLSFNYLQGIAKNGFTHVVNLAAALPINQKFALINENFLVVTREEDYRDEVIMPALALRFLGTQIKVDLGFVVIQNLGFPFPWLDFSYAF